MEEFFKFLIFVAPGFLAYEIYRTEVTRKAKSDFEYLAWSAINGVVVVFLYVLTDTFLGGRLKSDILFVNGLQWFKDGGDFLLASFSLFIFGIILGFVQIALLKFVRKFPKLFAPNFYTVWQSVIENPSNDWAVVFLKDGTIYLGSITNARIDPNTEDQDFLLSNARRINEKLKVKYWVTGIGVYLNTREVQKIEFLKSK